MEKEIKGKIEEIFNESMGIIEGDDGKKYYFSKIDFLYIFEIKLDKKIIFKPKICVVNGYSINKATYIGEVD